MSIEKSYMDYETSIDEVSQMSKRAEEETDTLASAEDDRLQLTLDFPILISVGVFMVLCYFVLKFFKLDRASCFKQKRSRRQ